jgi:hypothetical protein
VPSDSKIVVTLTSEEVLLLRGMLASCRRISENNEKTTKRKGKGKFYQEKLKTIDNIVFKLELSN